MHDSISFNRPTHPGTGEVHFAIHVTPRGVLAFGIHIVGDKIGDAGYVYDEFPAGTSVEDAVTQLQGTSWDLEPVNHVTVQDKYGNDVHLFHLVAGH